MSLPTRHFCTYFDKNYLSRGLALYDSIARHHPSFRLYVGCMDEQARAYLERKALPGLVVLSLAELEAHDPELRAVRSTRTLVEYYFTSTACWLRFVFDRHPEVDRLTYVDADLRFFSSSEPVWHEMGEASIGIVEHRFLPRHQHLASRGRFNVGWLSFVRDAQGMAAIASWRECCIEWCYDRLEGERYADQKYLDEWPRRFERLAVVRHPGVNVAPWNLGRGQLSRSEAGLHIDGQPLVCFHFHGLKHVAGPLYESGLRTYGVELDAPLREAVFAPYLRELAAYEAELAREGLTTGRARSLRNVQSRRARITEGVTKLATILRLLASKTYLLAPRADRPS